MTEDAVRRETERSEGLVRKGGLEPPRSCDRQPLKLGNLLRCREPIRILQTDVGQERADAHARADSIRTNSHTAQRSNDKAVIPT